MIRTIRENTDAWLFQIMGASCLWLHDNALGLLGAASLIYGMFNARQQLKLRNREVALKEIEAAERRLERQAAAGLIDPGKLDALKAAGGIVP